MKTSFSFKEAVWLVTWITISAIIISIITVSMYSFSRSGADWVSALISLGGNILGGIIGGIVAFIVAAYQVNKTILIENKKRVKNTITMLKLVREELKNNISTIDSALPYNEENYSLLKTQLTDDTWRSTMTNLDINDNLIVRLNICYKKIALIKNLSSNDLNDSLFNVTKQQIEETLKLINEEIKKLAKDPLTENILKM